MKRLVWGLCFVAGCATVPIDVYPAAARAVDDGQLLRALAYLDQIPPAHPHYPDARMLAQAVERRLRRSQELVLQGLELRAQWRDEEALTCFEEAQQIWTAAVGVDAWIEATRNRIDAARLPATPTQAGEVRVSQPEAYDLEPQSVESKPAWVAATEDAGQLSSSEPPITATGPALTEHAGPGPQPIVEVSSTVAGDSGSSGDPGAAGSLGSVGSPASVGGSARKTLAQIEALIEAGDVQSALDELDLCVQRDPNDSVARHRLVQVLHQRALQSYGRGWLDLAIADWGRLLQVDRGHPQARSFLQAATAEHERRAATSSAMPPR